MGALGSVGLFLENDLLRLALAVGIFASWIWSVRHHALLIGKTSLIELNLKVDGQVDGLTASGKLVETKIGNRTTVLPWIVVLRLIQNGSRRVWVQVLMPDALSFEDGRLLRIWLRSKSA